jgi:uncharacterized protein
MRQRRPRRSPRKTALLADGSGDMTEMDRIASGRSAPEHVDLPATAAWRHLGARTGFEVLFLRHESDGYHLEGHATAVEAEEVWSIRYAITLESNWATRSAHVVGRSALGEHEVRLESDGTGGWRVDGKRMADLTGCFDVDLEASACTNALPVRRLALEVGQAADAPTVYVRTRDLRVERLEQSYSRLPNAGNRSRYDYAAPSFDFRAVLAYDEFGLVLEYPGVAVRTA